LYATETICDLHLEAWELDAGSGSLGAGDRADCTGGCYAGCSIRDLSCLFLCGGREPEPGGNAQPGWLVFNRPPDYEM